MGDANTRKEIEETSQNTPITKGTAAHLEQTLLKFREELDQVWNLASLSITLVAPDVNAQNPAPPQNTPQPPVQPAHTQAYNTCNNTPLHIPEPQNTTNNHLHNTHVFVDTIPHYTQPISGASDSDDKDSLIRNLAAELKKLVSRVQGVECSKGVEGLNYKDLCVQPNVELPEGYKPPKFEMLDGTGDPRVHLRMCCDKLVGVGREEKIRMKLFMRSLKGDALSWYISQDSKKWTSWKKPTETFREYATRWRSEAAKVRPALEEEQMNRFFVRAQDPQYYERLMLIEGRKFSDIIKLGERIEEGIKYGMVTNLEALQTTNKALQSGGTAKKRDVNSIQPSEGNEINVYVPLEFEAPPAKAPRPIEVEFGIPKAPAPFEVVVLPPRMPIPVSMTEVTPFNSNIIPWDYTAKARRKGKTHTGEAIATQGMTRTGRVYTPEHLAESSKQAPGRTTKTGPDDLWRKIQAKEYSVVEQLNKTLAQISILALLQSSDAHKNALMKILGEAYVASNITGGEMENMVGQILESHKITFHKDELPLEGLSHNKALHITLQCEDYFITRILVDDGSSLNICPLITFRILGKGLHEIKDGAINVKAFDGSQRSTIGEISLCLQMGPTWFDVDFQVIDVPASYNLLLGRPWIHAAGAVASTLHQAVKFEWNHQEVIIHGDGSNPIYSRQTISMIEGRRRIGGETYHHIERVNAVDKNKWWDNKIESILNWYGYEPGKGLGKNLQGIPKPIKLKKHGTPARKWPSQQERSRIRSSAAYSTPNTFSNLIISSVFSNLHRHTPSMVPELHMA
ncbi:uncharacterized protein [Nicotiana sylvestris]|uniref:uncharacterized protein n=1 Tax=Nicotiana sylvestris TaxID=4096 RepID=UPI00388C7FB8